MTTVFSILRRSDGQPYTGLIIFRPAEGPGPATPDFQTGEDVEIIVDGTGFFTTLLDPGWYWVTLRGQRPFSVSVPLGGGTYLLADLIRGGTRIPSGLAALGANYSLTNGILQLLNADTGAWHTIWAQTYEGGLRLFIGAAGELGTTPNCSIVSQPTLSCLRIFDQADGLPHMPLIAGSDPFALAFLPAATPIATNYRVLTGALQVLNGGSLNHHSIWIVGATGAEALAIGPSEV